MALVKGLTEYLKKNTKTEIKTKGEIKMDIIELNGRKCKAIEEELKEGDYVVYKECVDNGYVITNEDMNLGEVVHVASTPKKITIRVIAHEDDYHENDFKKEYVVSNKHFRKATEEEVNKYKNGNPKHKIKVGDYVKSVSGRFCEVEEVSADFLRAVIAKCIRSGVYYNLPFEDVTKVEPTERGLSYIRAGREINHIKKGDIVSSEKGIRISKIDTKKAFILTLVCPVDKRTDI